MENYTITTAAVNPFTIPANCNSGNPSPAYPAFKTLSIYFFEEEEKKQGVSYAEWAERKHLAFAALTDFFTGVLNGDEKEMLSIYESYLNDNDIWGICEETGEYDPDDITGFDEFTIAHFKPGCWEEFADF